MKVIHVTEILFDHHLKAWRNSPGIAVDGCLLTYLGPDFCKKCKDGKPNNIHSAKFNSPFTEETPRFEVKFLIYTHRHTYIHTLRQTDGYTCIQNYIHSLLYSPSPFPLLLGALPLYEENFFRTAYVDHIDPATR